MLKDLKNISRKDFIRVENLPVVVLVIFFLSEAFTTIAFKSHWSFYNFSLIAKAIFLVAIGIKVFTKGFPSRNILWFLLGMGLVFLIGQLSFNDFTPGENFYQNCIYFGRYLFVFFVFFFLMNKEEKFSSRLFWVFEKLVILNSLLVLITILFNIQLFKTYYHRFGSSGIFMTPSMITYFNALGLTYFLYQYLQTKKKLPELLLVFTVCFLSGTKALFLFVILTIIHVLILKRVYLKKAFYYVLGSLVFLAILLRNAFMGFFAKNFNPLIEAYEEYGLIAALTSLRSENLKQDFLPVIQEKWTFLNYFFGGTDFEKYRVEFEPFDVILFFGFAGALLYFIFYFRKIINFRKLSDFGKVQIAFLLLIIILSGNFFNNAPVGFYLLIVLNFLCLGNLKSEKQKV